MIASAQSSRGRVARLLLVLLLGGAGALQGGDAAGDFRRGEERYQAGDWKGAAEAYAAVLTNSPPDKLALQALYSRGWALFQTGDFAGSLASFTLFLERYPADDLAGECRLKIGDNLRQLGRLDEAAFWYGAAATNAPAGSARGEMAAAARVLTLGQAGAWPRAEAAATEFLTQYPAGSRRPAIVFLQGECRYRQARYAAAVTGLVQFARQYATNDQAAAAWQMAGWCYWNLKQPRPARDCFAAVVAGYPGSPLAAEAAFMQGRAAEEEGDRSSAADGYREAVRLGKDAETARRAAVELIRLDHAARRYAAARAGAEAYLARYPAGEAAPRVRLYQAEALQELNLLPEALQAYGQVGACDDAAVTNGAAYGAAWVLRKLGRHAEAAGAFAAVAAGRSVYAGDALFWAAQSMYDLAWVLLEQGQKQEARQRFEAFARQYPRHPLAPDACFRIGELAYEAEAFAAAATNYEIAATAQVACAEKALYKLGWTREKLAHPADAAQTFQRFAERFPRSECVPEAWFRAGTLWQTLGRPGEARAAWEQVREGPYAEKAAYGVAASWRAQGRPAEAVTAYGQVLTNWPQGVCRLTALLGRADAWRALGAWSEALADYRSAAAAGGESREAAQAMLGQGHCWFALRKWEEAARCFAKVDLLYDFAELKPEALDMLARSWEQAGDAAKAALYRAERQKRYPARSAPP